MAGATVGMSGSGPQQVYVWCSYSTMNQPNNTTNWWWELVYRNNGGLSWRYDGDSYGKIFQFATGGPYYFSIPKEWTGTNHSHVVGTGNFNKAHDNDGYLARQPLEGYIKTLHVNIGEGTAYANVGTIPRVPRRPYESPAPVIDGVQSDKIFYHGFAPADNGGGSITTYEWQLLEEIQGPGDVLDQWFSATLNQSTRIPLDPDTTYRLRYRAVNAYGSATWSPVATVTTEAGIYVSTGSAWVAGGPAVSDGSSWVKVSPKISSGTAWQDPINV